jgi:gamma-glutamyltranspeptidase
LTLFSHGANRPLATGTRWAIAAGHPAAASTADAILRRGGSIVDAAIAASAVLTVVSPQATTLGGDGAMCLRRADGTVVGYDGAGWAFGNGALAFDEAAYTRGAGACVVPGLAALWHVAHEDSGILPFGDLLATATAYAERGAPVGRELHKYLVEQGGRYIDDQFAQTMFAPVFDGAHTFAQPALGRTLRTLAKNGPRDLYDGEIAGRLRAFLEGNGRAAPAAHFSDYRGRRVQPVEAKIGGDTIWAMPPPFVGLLGLLQLKDLEEIQEGRFLERRFVHHPALARRVFADWGAEIHDRWADGAGDADVARFCADALGGRRPPATTLPKLTGSGDTAGVVIVTADGQALSLLQSIFQPFGARLCDPETGILLNNRMLCFSPDGHNSPAPRRRPMHTLNPMILESDDEIVALCSPGGISQTTTCCQVIDAIRRGGQSADQAIDASRWSVARVGDYILENGLEAAGLSGETRNGFDEIVAPGKSFYFGSVKLATVGGGRTAAIGDLRREVGVVAA